MKLSQFRYNLPQELVTQYPAEVRDEARLLVVNRKTGEIEHKIFKDITAYFSEHDVLALNNTKVFPARLYGNKEKTGAAIEVFLLRELSREQRLWDVLVDPARKIRIGNKLYFGEDGLLVAEVIDNTTSRGRTLRFLFDGTYEELKGILDSLGQTPLPKFVGRKTEQIDKERYQTIYAKHEGAVAAPTAGLHFSREVLKKLEIIGVKFAEVTLHVGLGNFRGVDVEDLTKHKVDSERIVITDDAVEIINNAKDNRYRICAVGTTVVKTLESSVSSDGYLKTYEGWTNKFIFPPYEFKVPDMMISNFHMPYSTLLMTVAAFAGYNITMEAYNAAIKEKYRFGTYGDAMLVI
ncbi:MAG: tRNA preQ1(34) S-adenosylmethionine ribosyltransferase-isomerase QueA [Bacteroidales bacterium]|jgi:S-adenosylmethionine:tRNA ribosyltransferase-isomerase|nr:tRNA preQ1(34) S-adenosylmethionine ribosyltransferase-isomerase QueA [Bacteroidales bacterium]